MMKKQFDIYNEKILNPYLTSQTKVTSKWVLDFNVNHKTTKLLEENKEKYLNDLRLGKDFLDLRKKT